MFLAEHLTDDVDPRRCHAESEQADTEGGVTCGQETFQDLLRDPLPKELLPSTSAETSAAGM